MGETLLEAGTLDQHLLDQLLALCREAGDAIMAVYQRGPDIAVTNKADNSPVTAADRAAHAILDPGLRNLLPGVPVLSEEGHIPPFDIRRHWQRYWLVDPLDGTKEFIQRNGEFTVNVALVERGRAVLGVVHLPLTGVSYSGLARHGARKYENGSSRAIRVRTIAARQQQQLPIEVIASRRHGVEAIAALLERLAARAGDVVTRNMGSSLKFCLIAEAAADFYPRLAPTSEWDTAAAQAVVEAAGGAVLDVQLQPLRYNQKDSLLNPFFYVIGDSNFNWVSILGNSGAAR